MDGFGEARCAFCNMPITREDAFTRCSVCGKPYHTACWLLNSRCVTPDCNGEMTNETGFVPPAENGPAASARSQGPTDGGISIPRLHKDAVGAEKTAPAVRDTQIDEGLLNQFFGENQAYYRSMFRKLRKQKSPVTWNWVAFLIPGFWMIYRKMYVYGLALLVLNLPIMFLLPRFYPYFVLLQAVAAGMFGNLLYKFDIEQRLKKAESLSGAEQQNFLKHSYGTQKVLAYVSAGVFAFLVILLHFVF